MSHRRVVALIQARTGSARFPGKVLENLAGASVLQRVIDRTMRASRIDRVCVATTAHAADDRIVEIADARGAATWRDRAADDVFGPRQDDVLRRLCGAAKYTYADVVVRITADCPLIDPAVIDAAVEALTPEYDFVSNSIQRTYPRGLDVEVAWSDVLYRVERLADSHPDREHVFTYIYRTAPNLFLIRHLRTHPDNSELSWCVDYPEDLRHIASFWEDTDYRTIVAKVLGDER